ncbi:cytochrome P450 [Lenzites betulinus]|nr:cytochrome P450 [Lenzites betulinus]
MAYSSNLMGAAAILTVVVTVLGKRLFTKKRPGVLPPGPKGLPIIGNLLDLPSNQKGQTYAKWGESWGDIISMTILGQPYIILNSFQHAVDMFEKKSSIYSSRPNLAMGGELVGWNRSLILVPYGATFREYRRLIFQFMGSKKHLERFQPLLEDKARDFIVNLYKDPVNRVKHIQQCARAIILKMSYGYEVLPENDPFVAVADLAMTQFAMCTTFSSFLANVFPALIHVPAWFPGAGFKKIAAEWRKTLDEMCDQPYDFVKQQVAAGTNIPNFTSAHLKDDMSPERDELLKNAASSIYAGGADTTVSAINSFFLAMTLHPEVQRKAQAEIESVVGTDRVPTAADRENLPYIHAILLEVLRWNPVATLGAAHRTIEDDFHAGYYIPKGTIINPNCWWMLHNPETYADPMTFNPERFLSAPGKEPERDPRTVAFGFGRRICPGIHLAESSIYLAIAMSLAVFNFEKAVDTNGKPIEPSTEYTSGSVSHPPPYQCSITPRTAIAEALLRTIVEHQSTNQPRDSMLST